MERSVRDAVAGVAVTELDCVLVNLAVLADLHHGRDSHLALGERLRFEPRHDEETGLPTVEPTTRTRFADARSLLGITLEPTGDLVDSTSPVFVLADAHDLPWTPYHRRQHMEHSFLVVTGPDGARVVDAYHNDTPWGPARPGEWPLPALENVRFNAFRTRPRTPAAPDARQETGDADEYVNAYREHEDQRLAVTRLTLETWLLTRSRSLHARWLAHHELPAAERFAEHAARWRRFAEEVYIALRRVERGRAQPSGLHDRLAALLHADTSATKEEEAWTLIESKHS
ncbi:acyl carrier protein [Lentzea sp. NPDC005914]|uniref:acyl carrier protein n=1 Tax=Lentzea sp. NPDC005914 TaxID=3154572 RepID=UPI0033F93146